VNKVERNTMSLKLRELGLQDFSYRITIPTRWGDNDMLGHLNNVVYHRFIETLVVRFMIEEAGVDWINDPASPQAVESLCRFHRPLSFPDVIDGGLLVEKIGTSSVTFGAALFGPNDETAAATGHFVDVFVDPSTLKSVPMTDEKRAIFERYLVG